MKQQIFTFYSPFDSQQTVDIIKSTINALAGTIKKENENIIIASWRTHRFLTVLPPKFTFYVGSDMIRVVSSSSLDTNVITTDHRIIKYELIWDEFIKKLNELYPKYDFGLIPGKATLSAIKIVDNGIEQVMISKTMYRPSIACSLLGDCLFGPTGAIVGGMRGKSFTTGSVSNKFSDKLLAVARYSNGLTFDGVLFRGSTAYHMILANMSTFNRDL